MAYTVKQLAKYSGVSVRTLHYYDEIGLLKPAYYGDNNYRYYEDEQLLLLQQILFYRELGLPLNDIQQVVNDKGFDTLKALESHRKLLKGDLDRVNKLIKTIDKTIKHLRGDHVVKLEEIFEGFTEEKQAEYLDFLAESGVSQEIIEQSKAKVKDWSKEQWLANKQENDKLYEDIAAAIDKHLSPESDEVQALVERHYQLTKIFWTPNKESYIGLGDLYASNPDFVQFFESIHPKFLSFFREAMKIYAENNLS
ncbi:MAG: transcriptional regulator [Legionellaceae bacterium]|nr:transcriptional regulator [Legionellaceae bacterium]|tara:strand:- start:2245 stop:3003 length:759 start_codon:yes stop_codon:yes gene_type:complete